MSARSMRAWVAGASLLAFALLGCSLQAPDPAGISAHPGGQAVEAAPALPPHLRRALYPKWIDAKAEITWPPNDGYAAPPVAQTLPAGTLIDRFGGEGGTFFSPKGESFAARAVPYVCERMTYTVYRVAKPLVVLAGKAAPWFDEPGGAVQYRTEEPAFKLRLAGMIETAANDNSPDGTFPAPCGP